MVLWKILKSSLKSLNDAEFIKDLLLTSAALLKNLSRKENKYFFNNFIDL